MFTLVLMVPMFSVADRAAGPGSKTHIVQRVVADAETDMTHSQARFMACGYIAPALTQPAQMQPDGDGRYQQMLDELRTRLHRMFDRQ